MEVDNKLSVKTAVRWLVILIFCLWGQNTLVVAGPPIPEAYYVDKGIGEYKTLEHLIASAYNSSLHNTTFHLLSHGKPGELWIEGEWKRPREIAAWLQAHLTNGVRQINLYGCEFGKGTTGKAAVAYLQRYLGISVAASNNTTGKNGDWILEEGRSAGVLSFPTYQGNLQCRGVQGGTSPQDDFDKDGICNIKDIDDDNDGVTDIVEEDNKCVYTGGVDLRQMTYSGTPLMNLIPTSADGITVSGTSVVWSSKYSDKNFELPVHLEFQVDNISGNMIGLIPSSGIQNLGGFSDAAYKFYFNQPGTFTIMLNPASGNPGGPVVTFNSMDKFSIDIDASGVMKMYKNDLLFHSQEVPTGSYKLALTNLNINTHSYSGLVLNEEDKLTQDCLNRDTDSDGIPNRMDLDSDGDGCPDAFEANATTVIRANFAFTGNVGSNGLDNSLETSPDSGIINYLSDYGLSGVSTFYDNCASSDGDGIVDTIDIDDDNDGTPDEVEISCSIAEASKVGTTLSVPPTSNYLYEGNHTIANLLDGIGDSRVSSPRGSFDNAVWLNITLPSRKVLTYLEIGHYNNQSLFNPPTNYKIQGSNDNRNWADVSNILAYHNLPVASSGGLAQGSSNIASFPGNNTAYKYYRIYVISGIPSGYATELYMKERICVGQDSDGDRIPNRLDTDSDNNGCSDAFEAGATLNGSDNYVFTGDVGSNGLDNSLETFNDSGVINYSSSYDLFAISTDYNDCLDSDGDGTRDLGVDIDDDNDGTLDIDEMKCINAQISKERITLTIPSTISYSFNTTFGINSVNNLVDDVDNNIFVLGLPSGSLDNAPWLNIEFSRRTILTYLEIGHSDRQQLFTSDSKYKIQGSNDNRNWTDVTGELTYHNRPVRSAGTFSSFNSNSASFSDNSRAYKHYRIFGIKGISGGGYATELYFKERNCTDLDTDGDNIPNRVDLDSDGDGCSDAKEAGATTSSEANYLFTGNVGSNGLLNTLETAPESGIINYESGYGPYAISAVYNSCADSDKDGVDDFVDIDDDNDGVIDTDELSCGTFDIARSDITFIVPPTISYTYTPANGIGDLNDGIDDNENNISSPTGQLNNAPWLNIEFQERKILIYWELGHSTTSTLFTTTSTYKIQGSNDNSTWVDVTGVLTYNNRPASATGGLASANSNIAAFPNNNTAYRYYRMFGLNATSGGGVATELFTKEANCFDIDTDQNRVFNRLDLDSDGDGCSDANEAGATSTAGSNYRFTGNVGANGLDNSLESTPDSGVRNYQSSYDLYAISTVFNDCADTDNDSINDLVDIDDDNDGVPDEEEIRCESVGLSKNEITISIPPNISYRFRAGSTVNNLIDRRDNNTIVMTTPSGTLNEAPWLNITFSKKKILTFLEIGHVRRQQLFSATSTYKIQGSVDNVNWTDVSGILTYNNVPVARSGGQSTFNSTIASFPQNHSAYQYYRIYGIRGEAGNGWATELYFGEIVCNDIDTDGDHIPNRLDLDSDGNGCSDARESGATSSKATDFQFTGNVGSNGLNDALETTPDNGIVNYESLYSIYALLADRNNCEDTDNDGSTNFIDIDDDNDGALDLTEQICFIGLVPSNEVTLTIPPTIRYISAAGLSVNNLTDGRDDNAFVLLSPTGRLANAPWLNITFSTAKILAYLEIGHHNNQTLFSASSYYKVQGSHDNTNWVDVSEEQAYINIPVSATGGHSTYNSAVAFFPENNTAFRYYRIFGIRGEAGTGWATEVYFQEKECFDGDVDRDRIPNRLDPDTDNDGCSDANETSATSNITPGYRFTENAGSNGLVNSLETAPDNGLINYQSTYKPFAVSTSFNTCTDTDTDGVGDLTDLDDDSDGVPDVIEMNCSIALMSKRTSRITLSIPPSITYQFIDRTHGLYHLTDDEDDLSIMQYLSGELNNSPWLNIAFSSRRILTYLEIGHVNNTQLFSSTSTYKMQGSNDNVNWADVSGILTYNNLPTSTSGGLAPFTSNIASFPENNTPYRYYRIYGITGQGARGNATELYFRERICTDMDTDEDGQPNRLDTDSDNDRCSDAKEAGATTSLDADYRFIGNAGDNGLYNSLETSPDSGMINYRLTYSSYALFASYNACVDADNNRVPDVEDVDDDNDGLPDVDESVCRVSTLVPDDVPSASITPNNVTNSFSSGNASTLLNKPGLNSSSGWSPYTTSSTQYVGIVFPQPGQITAISTQGHNSNAQWVTTYRLQATRETIASGSQGNSVTWITLGEFSANTDNKSIVTQQITNLSHEWTAIRIAPLSWNGSPVIRFSVTLCHPSDRELDQDGVPNRLDADSDNDGITDNQEGQTTSSFIAPNGNDTDGDGLDDNYDPDNGGRALVTSDVDNDNILDYLDNDSDNDRLFDWGEGFDDNGSGGVMDDFLKRALAFELAAGYPKKYDNSRDSNRNGVPDWLDDDDSDRVPNFIEVNSSFYYDTNRNGLIDLYDPGTFGAPSILPDQNKDGKPDFRDIATEVILPVVLLQFDATVKGGQVWLNWVTATEENSERFEVYRSKSQQNWEYVGMVEAAGKSQSKLSYKFIDNTPLRGLSYYHLRTIDFDGYTEQSQVLQVITDKEVSSLEVKVWPNPNNGDFKILITDDRAALAWLTLVNLAGQPVWEGQMAKGEKTIMVRNIPSGYYVLSVDIEKEQQSVKVIIR